MDIDISVRRRGHEQREKERKTQATTTLSLEQKSFPVHQARARYFAQSRSTNEGSVCRHKRQKRMCEGKDVGVKKKGGKRTWMSVSTSFTNPLRSLACNECECTTSTIPALAPDLVTAAPLVYAVSSTGITTLPLNPLAFALTMGFGFDLNLFPLRSTVACPPLVDDSGAVTGVDVALDWLTLRLPRCGGGEATTFAVTSPGTSQKCSVSSRSLLRQLCSILPILTHTSDRIATSLSTLMSAKSSSTISSRSSSGARRYGHRDESS